MSQYKVLKDFDNRKEGEEITIDEATLTEAEHLNLIELVEGGSLEFIAIEKKDEVSANEGNENATVESVAPVRVYNGRVIISESTRELEGKEYHVVRFEDGTTEDLTSEQYAEIVTKE